MAQTKASGTRERLIMATSDLLQRKGLHGFGVNDVLVAAEAPKGVLYHHFPGGKLELAIAAVEAAVAQILKALQEVRERRLEPVEALRAWIDHAQQRLSRSGFSLGCPLAAAALESTPEDVELRRALDAGFSAIRGELANMLAEAGLTRPKARKFAALVVSAYEGALMQARIAGAVKPARDTVELLLDFLQRDLTNEGRP